VNPDPPVARSLRHNGARRVTGQPARSTTVAPAAPLAELSRASTDYAQSFGGQRAVRPRASFLLGLVASLIVGAVCGLAGRLDYRCGASFRVTGQNQAEALSTVQGALVAFVHQATADAASESGPAYSWSVDSPEPGLLSLTFVTPDRDKGANFARDVAGRFVATMQADFKNAQDLPSGEEETLAQLMEQFSAELESTRTHVEASLSALETQPRPTQRDAILSRWSELKDTFARQRRALQQAMATLATARDTAPPSTGLVSVEERRQVLEADAALQQDLRELAVNVAELRQAVLEIDDRSRESLDELARAADELVAVLRNQDRSPLQPAQLALLEGVAREAEAYRVSFERFRARWDTELGGLRQGATDPVGPDLLDAHQRIRNLLNDFLYGAARHLTAIRSDLRSLDETLADLARLYVLQSNVTRAFEVLQSAHHRFELNGTAMEPRDNHHIDAPLRAARGLHRRSQQRIEAHEELLGKRAIERARQAHTESIERASHEVTIARQRLDQAIAELIDLQDELNQSADRTARYLHGRLEVESASGGLAAASALLASTEQRRAELAAHRIAALRDAGLELVECGMVDGPINLPERFRTGGVAAIVTLLTMSLGQWWLVRRA